MPRILVVEQSSLIATDILETVEQEFPGSDAVAARTVEDAEIALNAPKGVDICIVSGGVTRDRLKRLANALTDRKVRTVAITDERSKADLFGATAVHMSHPFTSEMLVHAMRKVSGDDQDSVPSSVPG